MEKERKRILVVEDEESVRDTLSQILALEGYDAYSASNGQEAIRALDSQPLPNVIVLDLMMPVMDGWEFLEAVHKNDVHAEIPVIVVSAVGNATRYLARGSSFLKKPLDLDLLLSEIEKYCLVSRSTFVSNG